MDGYRPETYGNRVAPVYDDWYADIEDPGPAVDFLARVARSGGSERGPALELAVGTGRIALPLADVGIEVHGVDSSPAMVERMRSKPGGDRVTVEIGDMADVAIEVEGGYPLVFVVFNSFFGLLTQDDQVRCFANVAARLGPGGAFVMQAFVPDLGRFDRGQRLAVTAVGADGVRIDASVHDAAEQRVDAQHVVLGAGGTEVFPLRIRYAYPSELDLMARLAGMRLEHRFGGWRGEPFTGTSPSHVSVWRRP